MARRALDRGFPRCWPLPFFTLESLTRTCMALWTDRERRLRRLPAPRLAFAYAMVRTAIDFRHGELVDELELNARDSP